MLSDNYPDDLEEMLYEEREARRIYRNNLAHPDPRDPDHIDEFEDEES